MMSNTSIRRLLFVFCVSLWIAVPHAIAQQPPTKQTGETSASAEAAKTPPPEPPGQPINIRLDLTISDEMTPGTSIRRTVTMYLADRQVGNIRSAASDGPARLFIDARPQLLSNGKVQVGFGLDYIPHQVRGEEATKDGTRLPRGASGLNQRTTFVIEPGKPLIISQASDPTSDRTIAVEVRATIVK